MDENALNSRELRRGFIGEKGEKFLPWEDFHWGISFCPFGNFEGELRDGEEGLSPLHCVGLEVFPWTEPSPEADCHGCEEEGPIERRRPFPNGFTIRCDGPPEIREGKGSAD